MVWVGALKDFKYWQWVSTGDEVEYAVENDTVSLKCLALDIKSETFYAKNCSDGHAFVCESSKFDVILCVRFYICNLLFYIIRASQ